MDLQEKLKKSLPIILDKFKNKSSNMFPLGLDSKYLEQIKVLTMNGSVELKNLAIVRYISNKIFEVEPFIPDNNTLSNIEIELKTRGTTIRNQNIIRIHLPALDDPRKTAIIKELSELKESCKTEARNLRRKLRDEFTSDAKKKSDTDIKNEKTIDDEIKKLENDMDKVANDFIAKLQKL